jgi:hypothetical protein
MGYAPRKLVRANSSIVDTNLFPTGKKTKRKKISSPSPPASEPLGGSSVISVLPIVVPNNRASHAVVSHLKAPPPSSLGPPPGKENSGLKPSALNANAAASSSSCISSLSSLSDLTTMVDKKIVDEIVKQHQLLIQSQANQIVYLQSSTRFDPKLHSSANSQDNSGLDDNNSDNTITSQQSSLPSKVHLGRLEQAAQRWNRLKAHVHKSQQYNGTELGRRLYGAALALSPTTSLENFELTAALTLAAFMADAGAPIDLAKCADALPSQSTLKRLVHKAATDSIFNASQEIVEDAAKVFLICDKGAGGKVANAHFVKILSWYSHREQRVKTFNVDTDEAAGKSENAGDAVDHSLTKMFGDRSKDILYGQATDSGGGGVGWSLKAQLDAKELTCPHELYLVSFCTLHCIQLTLGNPIEHVLGQGGKEKDGNAYKQTAMQLLHGVYNLQRNHESDEWKRIWNSVCADLGLSITPDAHRIPAPILTRWWTVGVAAGFLLENWDIIDKIVHGSIQCRSTDKAVNQIASGVQSLMKTPQVKSDVHLIDAFHKHFLNTHFAFLQKGDDEIGGTPCFINRHIGGRYFLMHCDIVAAKEWRSLEPYNGFVASLLGLDDEQRIEQTNKANKFLGYARLALEKHFDKWVNDLLFLSLFSEAPIATRVARFLVGRQGEEEPRQQDVSEQQYFSKMHNRSFDLTKFDEFLAKRCRKKPNKQGDPPHPTTKLEDILASQHVAPHLLVIRQLVARSSGSRGNMWDEHASILLKQFRKHYLDAYAALPSSTHIAESNVKDANYCQIKGRGEALASAYSTARSDLVEPINRMAKKAFQMKDSYKANGAVMTGPDGTRKRRGADETDFDSTETKRVRGRIFSKEAIRFVVGKHKSIERVFDENPAKKEVWRAINECITKKENQFAAKRIDAKVQGFELHKNNNKPPNMLQRRTGIHKTPLVLGRIAYSKLKKGRDMEDIKKELECRQLPSDGGWLKQLLVRLKASEGDTKSFKPRHPDLLGLFDKIVAADLEG